MPPTLLAIVRIAGIIVIATTLNLFLLFLPGSLRTRAKITSSFFRILLSICGIELDCKIPSSELLSKGRYVIVANHISYLDIVILSALRPCVFLAKREVASWPLFGWIARSLGCIFVHRESLMGRANALRKCLLASYNSDIALFPEGTTTSAKRPDLKTWAKGHAWIAQRGIADGILCLGLSYEKQAESAWTDDMSLMPHLMKTLRRPRIRVTVTGAWVEISRSTSATELSLMTHQKLCLAVSNECTY